MGDASFVGHEPCPGCGSKDNLARYSDASAYCFGCGHHEKSTGGTPAPSTPRKEGKSMLIPHHEIEIGPLRKRGITDETCDHFKYGVADFKGRKAQVAPYFRDGQVVAQKVRFPDKDFTFLGEPKKAGLFGQHKCRDGGKQIVITEGEIDCLTVSQLQGNKWPVVSVPNGAQGAAKSVAKEIEFLESFEKVVFMFDMDEPGIAAAKECASLLSPGKAFIASLPMKDANEMLQAGRGKEVIDAMWGAKAFRPDGVVDVASVIDQALMPIEIGKSWPWAGMARTYGRRGSELYGFGGGTGCGKSTIFKQIALHVMENEGLPVGMLMLEEPPKHTLRTLAGMKMRARTHVPGTVYDLDEYREALEWLKDRVFFYDHFGSMGFETIKEKIRYMVRALGIKDIFLDHLTALAASIDTDERKAIDKIMAELSSLTQELDCTIYYVSHLTTPEGKPHEEGGRVLEKQFRGSRSIAYWSHFLFGIERDKQDQGGVITFRVLKDRYTGDAAGDTFGLRYDRLTGLLDECPIPSGDESPFGAASGNEEY